MKHPKPASHLGAEGRALWREMLRDYEITDGAGLALLLAACEAADRAASARRAVGKRLQVRDRYGCTKPHPLLNVERDARHQMITALKALKLAPGGTE